MKVWASLSYQVAMRRQGLMRLKKFSTRPLLVLVH